MFVKPFPRQGGPLQSSSNSLTFPGIFHRGVQTDLRVLLSEHFGTICTKFVVHLVHVNFT